LLLIASAGAAYYYLGPGSSGTGGGASVTSITPGGGSAATTSSPGTQPGATTSVDSGGAQTTSAPGSQTGLVAVSIDAHPWARVAITAVGSTPRSNVGTLVTPVTIDLAPGEYELTLENGGVTQPLTRRVRVAAGARATFNFPMPGFSPEAVVDQLLGSGAR
jgi:hypothetical protein